MLSKPLTFVHCHVQKGDLFITAFRRELDGGVDAIDLRHVLVKLLPRSSVDQEDIVYEPTPQQHLVSSHGSQCLLHMSHEYARIRWCPVMPRSAIIDPVTFTANRTGSTRSRWRTNSDRVFPIRSRWRFDGWPPGFKPVPVDIRSKLTARIKFNNHLVYI